MIKLRRRLVILARPVLAAIEAQRDPAIVRDNHAIRILRINPHAMIVAVRHLHFVEGAPAVTRPVKVDIRDVNHIGRLRVRNDVHVIPRPLPEGAVVVQQFPGFAAIVGAIQPALGSLNQRIHTIGIRGHGDSNFAVGPFGQAVFFKPLPCASAIVRTIESAARTAARQSPRGAPRLPQRCEKNVRVARIKRDIDAARVLILAQNFLPGLSSVGGAEDAALGIRAERVAQRSHVDNIRILGIDNHFPNCTRVMQAHVFPGLSAINCFVNSISMRDVAPNARFARSHIHDVRIRRRNRQASNRGDCLLVENGSPSHRAVGRLPYPAAG